MRTVIVGQGAIGLLCYHRLNKEVSANAIGFVSLLPSKIPKDSYYYFQEQNATTEKFALKLASTNEVTNAQLIIICVKSYQVKTALQNIHHLIADNAIIILSHNGLGTFEEINHWLKPKQCLLTLLLTQGVRKVGNYSIEHTGMGNSDLGIIFGKLSSAKQDKLIGFLQHGLRQLYWQENIEQAQWRKLAINCVINPLTALDNVPNGDINKEKYQEKIKLLIREFALVANREGLTFSQDLLFNLIRDVASNTAQNTSSMRADILAKRRTEIAYINGYIHRLGEKHLLDTPHNTQLWLEIKAIEDSFNL